MNRAPILIVNPGSTSTKVGMSVQGKVVLQESIAHRLEDLAHFQRVWDQYPLRLSLCAGWAEHHSIQWSAVVGIGGLLRPVEGGTYLVNERMVDDARANLQGEHVSNLGCAIAREIALRYGCPAFTVDPVSVNEFDPLACYSGHPHIVRKSLSHALNIHAMARRAAAALGKQIDSSRFVVAHLGGGISVAAVRNGLIVDVNDASSDGPFSVERSGGLPLQQFMDLCFNGGKTEKEIRSMVMGKGGMAAYLATTSATTVEGRIFRGDSHAREVFQAMAYQISKEIGAMSVVLRSTPDAIVLTGGLAQSRMLTAWIEERVSFLSPVLNYPGEDEIQALAEGAERALDDKRSVKTY